MFKKVCHESSINQDLWSILWYILCKVHFYLSGLFHPLYQHIYLWIIYFLAFLSVHNIWLVNVSSTELNTLMTFMKTRRYSFIQVAYCFTNCKYIIKQLLLEWLLYQSISYIVRQISNYHLNECKSWRLLVDLCLLVNLALNSKIMFLRMFEFSYPNTSHLHIAKFDGHAGNLYKCKHQFSESSYSKLSKKCIVFLLRINFE